MAIRYVKNTGSNTAPYDTWAKAATTLKTAMEVVTGTTDTIYVSSVHSEASGASVTISGKGTDANPYYVISVDDSAEPPTQVAGAVGTIGVTGANTLQIDGSAYFYGLNFFAGSSTSAGTLIFAGSAAATNQSITLENCGLSMLGSGAAGRIRFGSGSASAGWANVQLNNCAISFLSSSQRMEAYNAQVEINGGATASASTPSVNGFFSAASNGRQGKFLVSGFDFSSMSSALALVASSAQTGLVVLRDCKLPASWAGALVVAPLTDPYSRVEMHNCDSANTNYRLWTSMRRGEVLSETTVVRSGGASDGTTPLSWNMTISSSNISAYPLHQLYSPEIVAWNEVTGRAITATVEVLTDNVTLQDDDCWLEVMYLSSSSSPLGTWVSNKKATFLTAAANHPSSTASWTTTGLTTPVKQKLSVTFTPQNKGPVIARVAVATSLSPTVVYVDPKLVIS